MDDLGRRPSGTPPYWQRGEQITWTYGRPGEPSWIYPMTVVRDDAELLATWLTVGTLGRVAIRADGRELRADPATVFTAPRKMVDRAFFAHHTLRLHEPGRPWSVLVFFDADTGDFVGWYCNIEDPHTRDESGTYTRDHVLDIWVDPDRTFHRKDEDELELAVEQGRYTAEEAAAITAVADEIEEVIKAWGPPFCDGWENYRP
ncbi:DUF402 domain-containing protein [Nocardioides humilatus]|uniref:DUF402 domain-containing protein n=1 Tax=Nocardioides humilatus TaxID=2607660 RepID=A0A5B1LNG6_9ACTN|nr:DUF402 domain-containing protein [Nocardioides humilatus]KAA1421179.1 DUF402 domain-containing protein [Nocardioides humilatus]